MSDSNHDNGSEGHHRESRWMGLTAYQQMLLLPPILLLAGTTVIPGVTPQLSVAGGALALALVLLGLFWPGAAGRGKRRSRRREDGDEDAKKYSPEE
jgi:hypothetical protein